MEQDWLCKATERISTILNSYEYKCDSRLEPAYFSREGGEIGFVNMIAIRLNFLARSMQTELDDFFEHILKKTEGISKQAFAEARFKLTVNAFRLLFEDTAKLAACSGFETFKGYRVLAFDGTVLMLEDTYSLREHFGVETGCAAARASVMADMLNCGLILDAEIDKLACGERELAVRHIRKLKELNISKPLLTADRGYASAEMLETLLADSIPFLFRLQKSFNAEIDRLPLGDHDKEVTIKKRVFRLRILKFRLSSGEIETLITNLPNNTISADDLKELYRLRWGVETAYRVLKSALQIENFTGTSQLVVKQDFFATVFLKNMASFAKIDSNVIVAQNHKPSNLYQQQTNENLLIGKLKDKLILALLESDPLVQAQMINAIIQQAARHPIPICPGRHFPHLRKHSNHFHLAGKSSL